MTETERITAPWLCPVCAETIDVTMWWTQPEPPSLIRVRKVDDVNARVHMEWHRLCICQWRHDHSTAPVTVERIPDPACEMHP
jgi:hypothetical protein